MRVGRRFACEIPGLKFLECSGDASTSKGHRRDPVVGVDLDDDKLLGDELTVL